MNRSPVIPAGALYFSIKAAGAADAELALLLGVEVHEDIPFENTRTELVRPGHTGFLVIGYKHLDRSMLHFRILED